MNSFTLEKDRLRNKPSDIDHKIDYVRDRISTWDDLSEKERAEVLSYIRIILAELKTNIQKSWRMGSFVDAVTEYREFENFVACNQIIQDALSVIVVDPSGAPLDYKWEIARDRERVNFLFDQILNIQNARVSSSQFLNLVSNSTHEESLKTLAKYESEALVLNEQLVFASFVKAFNTSFNMNRVSRAGEIAADFIASHPFLGNVMRDKAYALFHQALLLEGNLTHMVRRTVVKKVVRAVWIWYWKGRLTRNFASIDSKLIELLSEHAE